MKKVIERLFRPSVGAKTPTRVSREPKYLELDWKSGRAASRYTLRVLPLNDFTDVEGILDHLRDRSSVVILKVKPSLVQEKLELKRALKRVQRTCAAIGGDIAGIKEDIIVITPPDIAIFRSGALQPAVLSELAVSNPLPEEPAEASTI